jgi:hypothetical protein
VAAAAAGFEDYETVAKEAAVVAAARRKRNRDHGSPSAAGPGRAAAIE